MYRHRLGASLALVALIFVSLPQAEGQVPQSRKLLTVEQYLDYETVLDPQISPDGSQVVYTRRWVNKFEDKWETALWIVDADASRNRFLTKGSNATWSPDGTRIAYLAEGEPKGSQVFVRWMDQTGATTQVTRVEEAPADLRWSPDSKWIGFSMFVPHESTWNIDMPKPPEGAKWTKPPAVIDRLHYRHDGRGYSKFGYSHLFVVPADGGSPRALTTGEWNVGGRKTASAARSAGTGLRTVTRSSSTAWTLRMPTCGTGTRTCLPSMWRPARIGRSRPGAAPGEALRSRRTGNWLPSPASPSPERAIRRETCMSSASTARGCGRSLADSTVT